MVLPDSLRRNDIPAPPECFSSIFPEKKCYHKMTKHKIIKFEPCCLSPTKFCKILDVSDINFTEVRNLTEKIEPNNDSWRKNHHSFVPFPLKKRQSTANQNSHSICWNHMHDLPDIPKNHWQRLRWMAHLRNRAGNQGTWQWGQKWTWKKSQVLGLLLMKQLCSYRVFPSHCI